MSAQIMIDLASICVSALVYLSDNQSFSPPLCEAIAKIHDLFDVVNHTVQKPLYVYLDLPSEDEPVKPLIGEDIPEDRLNDGHPLGVDFPAFLTIDLLNHEFGEVDPIRPDGDHQIF
jgi:hypothetical protein